MFNKNDKLLKKRMITSQRLYDYRHIESTRINRNICINMNREKAKEFLENILIDKNTNATIIDNTDYELLYYIEYMYGTDPEIAKMLEEKKRRIVDNYVRKQQYILRITSMPE